MPHYYFFKNDSHLYVYRKPLRPMPMQDEWLNDYLGQLNIHLEKVKPFFVNCTVAPLAEECRTTTAATDNFLAHDASSTSSATTFIERFLSTFTQQYEYGFILSLLLIVVCLILFIFSTRSFLRKLDKYRSKSSLMNGGKSGDLQSSMDTNDFFVESSSTLEHVAVMDTYSIHPSICVRSV